MQEFDFEFDLSDEALLPESGIEIIIPSSTPEKPLKIANKVGELTSEQKFSINNLMWNNEDLTDNQIMNLLTTYIGVGEKLAFNMVTFHRHRYLEDKGFYSIFDLDKDIVRTVAHANKMFLKKVKTKQRKQLKAVLNVHGGFCLNTR